MTNSTDQERQAFEAAFENMFYTACFERHDSGEYVGRGLQGAWLGWQARAQQPASVAVPDGWKLVPVEPTTDMVNAFKDRVAVTSRGSLLNTGHALTAAINAAPHPVSGEQKSPSVQITGHLDEVDAPVWQFINAEARKLWPITGSIDTYGFARPNGSQPNGSVVVLWNGMSIHALALTVRDSLNRTQCVRLLATPPAAQDVAGLVEALEYYAGCGKSGNVARVALAAHRAQQEQQP